MGLSLNFYLFFSRWHFCLPFGQRSTGLRFDDLIPDEDPVVVEALSRLSPKERFDREFRMKRALMASVRQDVGLPKDEWTKPEEDVPYLKPILATLESEILERQALDNMDSVPRQFLRKNKA